MSIKSDLSTLQSNISNVKNKLYTNLTEKGVTTITTASTLSDMADSVTLITTGSTDVTATTETKLVNSKWLIQPDELKDEYLGRSNKFNWLEENADNILIYPTGDYVFNQDWDVTYFDGSSWVPAKHTDGSDYTTRCTWNAEDYYRLKNDSRYRLAANAWNDWTGEQNYYTATELPLYNLEQIFIRPVNLDNMTYVSAFTGNEFEFYEYNEYNNEHIREPFVNPYNNNEYTFYPIVKTQPYYKGINYSYYEHYDVIGAVINGKEVNDGILKLNAWMGDVTGEYLLFVYNGIFYDKFSFEFAVSSSNNIDYPFDYIAPNVTRLEYVTANSGITNFHYGFYGSYIDYVGEFTLGDNVSSIYDYFTGDYMEYLLIKNIGATDVNNHFNFLSGYWGSNEKYSNSRQSLTDSLITYSYDRVAAGYTNVCNIVLNSRTKARLTEEEIAQITAKGYTIA